jgi:cobyrinic acid a,c-diamide synthase
MPDEVDKAVAKLPRVMIAGLRGSGGKTFVSLGLTAALRGRRVKVAPYKKGADYIDAAWLGAAAGAACRNLDLFMVESEAVLRSFLDTAGSGDIALIEGNRGLYDGMDAAGTYSAAEVAKLIKAPVVLVCDCTKTTRTIGAIVHGCRSFDPEVDIKGVILNHVSGPRHESVLREVVAEGCGLPVLGAIPKIPDHSFPERHLGLVPPQEHGEVPEAIAKTAKVAEEYLAIDSIIKIAQGAPPLEVTSMPAKRSAPTGKKGARKGAGAVKIAVLRDEAFQFYYPENLEALEREGAELVYASPLADRILPEADAIYIGGGFPETLAERLVANESFRAAVAGAVESGVPVYAECAGAVYLGEKLLMEGNSYPMAGALPVVFGFGPKPQGHGYTNVKVVGSNPFYRSGETLKGHEFHYSRVLDLNEKKVSFVFEVTRGFGVDGARDGMCRKNALATYCHIHALGVTNWARSLVKAGAAWSEKESRRPK